MPVGVIIIDLYLPGCTSLKEKRQRLKPLIVRLHREYNISVAEIEFLDIWQSSRIGCSSISNDGIHCRNYLLSVVNWIDTNWPDIEVVDSTVEIL